MVKRVIACVAVATATTFVAVTPAQAAPADPVAALKSRFAAGKGVKFTDVTTLVVFEGNTSFLKRTGSFQFGRTGIVASDTTTRRTVDEAEIPVNMIWRITDPERTIRIGTTSYYSGGAWAPSKGKTWIKHPRGMSAGLTGWHSQLVNAAEPATLKALINKGKRTGRTYSGTISFGALEKVSPWLRNANFIGLSEDDKAAVLRFRLTLGADRLPQRLVTVYPRTTHSSRAVTTESGQYSVETRYTGWGSRVSVKAPPAGTVENMKTREPTVRGGGRG